MTHYNKASSMMEELEEESLLHKSLKQEDQYDKFLFQGVLIENLDLLDLINF